MRIGRFCFPRIIRRSSVLYRCEIRPRNASLADEKYAMYRDDLDSNRFSNANSHVLRLTFHSPRIYSISCRVAVFIRPSPTSGFPFHGYLCDDRRDRDQYTVTAYNRNAQAA